MGEGAASGAGQGQPDRSASAGPQPLALLTGRKLDPWAVRPENRTRAEMFCRAGQVLGSGTGTEAGPHFRSCRTLSPDGGTDTNTAQRTQINARKRGCLVSTYCGHTLL